MLPSTIEITWPSILANIYVTAHVYSSPRLHANDPSDLSVEMVMVYSPLSFYMMHSVSGQVVIHVVWQFHMPGSTFVY